MVSINRRRVGHAIILCPLKNELCISCTDTIHKIMERNECNSSRKS